MKIRFLSGPRQGETSHAPYSQQTQLLIAAGLIEVVDSPKPRYGSTAWQEEKLAASRELNPWPRTEPRVSWGIKIGTFNGRPAITASCSNPNCNRNFRYEGPTFKVETNKKGAKERVLLSLDFIVFNHSCGALFNENVPAHVVAEYRKAYAEGNFLLTPDESKMHAALAQPGDSNKRVDLVAIGYVKKGALEF
jgi:hypothetical protein